MNICSKKMNPIVICIRMGNTNSSISYINENGKVIIITSQEGERQIPIAISYLDGEEYHGMQAKFQLVRNSRNTIIHYKKFLGEKMESIDLIEEEYSAQPSILNNQLVYKITSVSSEGELIEQMITLEEVMISHLKYLKQCAIEYIGKSIMDVVFTIPTDFSTTQIEILEDCAKKAGLNVLQFIKESIAQVLAYSEEKEYLESIDRIVVVADFGEIRSDATVIAFRNGMYTILATQSNEKLGGKLLDECLVNHFLKEFQKKYNLDPSKDAKAMAKLRIECEATKKSLSSNVFSTISVECMFNGYDFFSNINRIRFEILGKHIFDEMVSLVKNVIKKAQLEEFDIDELILAGGTSHIPKISNMFSYIFPEKTLIRSQSLRTSRLSPSDIESYGAAIHVSLISSFTKSEIDNLMLPEITSIPHLLNPIGVVVKSDDDTAFIPMIHSYTPVPVQKSIILHKPSDLDDFHIIIYEAIGHIHSKKTNLLSQNTLSDTDDSSIHESSRILTPSKKIAECILQNITSSAKIKLTIQVDSNLKTTITATPLSPLRGPLLKGEILALQKNI
ncbi:hypothetical protein T552_00832 [Pneumocystis carinii B80]|uniref:Uncharacterized protein n=1 Tax=Pneumocystis carinii (strain B80) TaxID=1408658 RepID=A0A0W4ZPQ4_PNEC8|nr:hypothetical protein T552_00832 [Pneumocystis carinii B80]KTW30359.1 hypothetical protein T552_00832 [Pneumocystis carinii B80]